METLSVQATRRQLSTLLDRFRSGDRTPVGVGPDRRAEAVMIPIAVYEELTAERTSSAAQAAASLEAEGLTPSAEAKAITERWTRGEISTAQMRSMIRHLHGIS